MGIFLLNISVFWSSIIIVALMNCSAGMKVTLSAGVEYVMWR